MLDFNQNGKTDLSDLFVTRNIVHLPTDNNDYLKGSSRKPQYDRKIYYITVIISSIIALLIVFASYSN